MRKVGDFKDWEIEGNETSGAMEYLLYLIGCDWEAAPTPEQEKTMLVILNAEFEPEEGEALYWGTEGKVFEVVNNQWAVA